MRHYECVYILDPALAEEDLGSLAERFRQVVVNQGGTVDALDRWERRRLAYEIKGKREGVYYVMNFSANPGAESELQRVLRLTDGVLRHIVVQLDELALKHMMQAQAAARAHPPAPAAQPAPIPPAPVVEAVPVEQDITEPPTTEPEIEEATPEAVAASEDTKTEES